MGGIVGSIVNKHSSPTRDAKIFFGSDYFWGVYGFHQASSRTRVRPSPSGIVDFPDRIAELFIKCCLQNGGVLSKKKQKLEEFQELTNEEVNALEKIITKHFPESAS